MTKSIFSNEWHEYAASIIFVLMLPLLPILFELLVSYKIATSSLTIMASFYAIAVGVSSHERGQFWVGSITCIIFAGVFGFISQNHMLSLSLPSIVLVILLLIASGRGILVMLNDVSLFAISILIGTVLVFLVGAINTFIQDSPFFLLIILVFGSL
ncbi:membrane protein [Beggiatoa sp. PS]|nr:membrane protein [Beggiatoa sp. PS]